MNVHFKDQMKYIIHNRAWGNMNEKKKKYAECLQIKKRRLGEICRSILSVFWAELNIWKDQNLF